MKNKLSKPTLYNLVLHKKCDRVFDYLHSKEELSDFESAIYCLAYAMLGDNYEYRKWYGRLNTRKVSREVETIIMEAELLTSIRLKESDEIVREKTSQILKRNRKSVLALSTMGQTQFMRNDIPGALETFDKLTASYPLLDWLNRIVAFHLIAAKHYKKSTQYSARIKNPLQRIAYVWAANFVPLRLYFYLMLAVALALFSTEIASGIIAFIWILITPFYIYFVWIKDKYMFGLLGNTIFLSGLAYLITKYINL